MGASWISRKGRILQNGGVGGGVDLEKGGLCKYGFGKCILDNLETVEILKTLLKEYAVISNLSS